MQPSVQIATSVLQVLVLVFAGFGTLAYRAYDTDTSKLSNDSPEVLAWILVSFAISFVFPAYLLTLLLLSQAGGGIVDIVIFLLSGFIAVPVLLLSISNLVVSVLSWDGIEWKAYQRVLLFISSVSIFVTTAIIIYHAFFEKIL